MQNYLKSLNSRQYDAVTTTEGPLLIIAGAGTGKTKTLVFRIFHLMHQGNDPRSILGVTFTNKAAKEMMHRIKTLIKEQGGVGDESNVPLLCTFHALGVHILRRHADKIGYKKSFVILDRADVLALIKRAMIERDIDTKEWEPRRILGVISRAKSSGMTAESFQVDVRSSLTAISQEVWIAYERYKRQENSFDFDDLLLHTHQLLRDHVEIRGAYQRQWKYIHIDEYQDTNKIQYDIIRLLVGSEHNICVVGDSDQTIYTWRGASMRNIMQFEKDFPGARAVILDINYRSTVTILSAAQAVIEKNEVRHKKVLQSAGVEGDPIIMYQALNESDEAHFVIKKIQTLVRTHHVECSEIAVLFRANFQSRVFEEVFLHAEIPYHVAGVRFFERKEIKDVLSYIRAALVRENLSDLVRVMEYPRRGLGKVAITKVCAGAADELSGKAKIAYTQLMTLLDTIREYIQSHTPSEIVEFVIRSSGIEHELKKGTTEDLERLENVRELVSYATRYDVVQIGQTFSNQGSTQIHLQNMLENIALMSDQDTLGESGVPQKSVKLMTVHAAKGLEFEHVFIVGLEQGLFPSDREDIDSDRDYEEERRLMYVALTRAKKNLYLSYTQMRRVYGKVSFQEPSEFLSDIPSELITWESERGLLGGLDDTLQTVYLDF